MKITSDTPISHFWSLFPVIIESFLIFLSSETVPEAVNTQLIIILDCWVCWVSHSWVVLLKNFSPHFLPSNYPSLHLSNPSQKSPDSTPFPFLLHSRHLQLTVIDRSTDQWGPHRSQNFGRCYSSACPCWKISWLKFKPIQISFDRVSGPFCDSPISARLFHLSHWICLNSGEVHDLRI